MNADDNTDLIHQAQLIGANLRALRLSKDCSLEELSRQSGFSKSFLSLVESGKRSMRPFDMRRLLALYNFSLGYFLSCVELSVHPLTDPDAPILHERQGILLDGKRKPNAYSLVMPRCMKTADDTQLLCLRLPPQSQMSDEFLSIETIVRGVVVCGTLLIDMRGDEYVVREGEEFRYDGKREHLLRNYTNNNLIAYLWIEGGKF